MTDIKLFGDERVDTFFPNNIKIIQSSNVFSFSLDAILLANFVHPSNDINKKAVDLCSGNGAIGLFISSKFAGNIVEVEIQNKLANMAKRSIILNNLTDRMKVYNIDLNDSLKFLKSDSFDIVTCNPPYFMVSKGSKVNPNHYLAIARHEIKVTLQQTIKMTSRLLKMKGKAYFVNRPDRILELFDIMRQNRLIPKKIQLIYPKKDKNANIILVEAIKDGNELGLKFIPSLVVYNEKNEYTEQLKNIIYGETKNRKI